MEFRTDLALEQRENLGDTPLEGVRSETRQEGDARVTTMEILTSAAAERLGKPIGRYITVELPPLTQTAQTDAATAQTLADALGTLLPPEGAVLIAGLGNPDITPDALGPLCADGIFATRHIGSELAKSAGLGDLRPVADVTPGVLGKTGIETKEILTGILQTVKPAALITVDALAARRLSRLGCTVQMTDTGIVPGSGVGNARCGIDRESVGVPVIAVGVPTVVDAVTLAYDLLPDHTADDRLPPEASAMMVTPRETNLLVSRAAQLLSLAINLCLQPQLSPEDLLLLTG